MNRVTDVTNTIELLVGAACLVGAFAAWQRALRGAAIFLGIGGIVAIVHAVVAFA